MRKPRWIANQESVEQSKSELLRARSALEGFRQNCDASRFPDLQRRISGSIHGLSLEGFGQYDVEPRLTQNEYNRFEAAYRATQTSQMLVDGSEFD
jgi:hypothetical protein